MLDGARIGYHDGDHNQLFSQSSSNGISSPQLHDLHSIYGHFHIYHVFWILYFLALTQDDASWKYDECVVHHETGDIISICDVGYLDQWCIGVCG